MDSTIFNEGLIHYVSIILIAHFTFTFTVFNFYLVYFVIQLIAAYIH